jgi:hypothetical protein
MFFLRKLVVVTGKVLVPSSVAAADRLLAGTVTGSIHNEKGKNAPLGLPPARMVRAIAKP